MLMDSGGRYVVRTFGIHGRDFRNYFIMYETIRDFSVLINVAVIITGVKC